MKQRGVHRPHRPNIGRQNQADAEDGGKCTKKGKKTQKRKTTRQNNDKTLVFSLRVVSFVSSDYGMIRTSHIGKRSKG